MCLNCATIKLRNFFEEKLMSRTAFVRARVEPALKIAAENVLTEMGITPTQALTMLYKRIARDHEWPLELKVPNAKTRKTFEETDKGAGLTKHKNIDDLFGKLGI
jgi:DNA-damage-inducible protein J